jgi:hypothetical protein
MAGRIGPTSDINGPAPYVCGYPCVSNNGQPKTFRSRESFAEHIIECHPRAFDITYVDRANNAEPFIIFTGVPHHACVMGCTTAGNRPMYFSKAVAYVEHLLRVHPQLEFNLVEVPGADEEDAFAERIGREDAALMAAMNDA